jgi:hypothetical protein
VKDTVIDSGFFTEDLATRDPAIFGAITDELGRQRDEIELIASENIVSRAVLAAQGSVMTNKYAEGYPGRRYYGGCRRTRGARRTSRSSSPSSAPATPFSRWTSPRAAT